MSKKIKLHLGNGTVYLDGYINIDIIGELASERPDLVEKNRTTVENYYQYPVGANRDSNVTDMHMDAGCLSYFKDNSVDEILSVNLIDHIKKEEFLVALKEWKRVLKPGGVVIIDIDDRQKEAKVLTNAKTIEEIEWAFRLIYCDHASEGRTHWWGYTPEYLKKILIDNGFEYVWTKTDYITHDVDVYPSFQVCVKK